MAAVVAHVPHHSPLVGQGSSGSSSFPSATASSSTTPSTTAAQKSKSDGAAWEFTRRKRWPELLINELAEAIALILSPAGKILFCSPAVTELLGWRDEELIDADLSDLVNEDDRPAFRAALGGAVHAQRDLLAYARLRCKTPSAVHALQAALGVGTLVPPPGMPSAAAAGDYGYAIPLAGPSTGVPPRPPPPAPLPQPGDTKEVLFEIAAYPHVAPPAPGARAECRCVFAVAKPYLSRNTAMLNTFLELKVENERLQQRLAALRTHAASGAAPARPRVALRPPPLQLAGLAQQQAQAPSAAARAQASPLSAGGFPGAYGVPVAMPMPLASLAGGAFVGTPAALTPGVATGYYAGYTEYAATVGLVHEGAYRYVEGAPPAEPPPPQAPAPAPAEPASGAPPAPEEESAKKKAKRRHAGEQFVCRTCGRTDSPEWRKGPQGPKTLCNACGLRWAKQVRRGGEEGE